MNYCTACGTKLTADQHFCTECGVKQSPAEDHTIAGKTTPENVPTQPVEQQTRSDRQPRKPMTKRTKILIGLATGIILLLFGTHQFLSSYFDPMKDLQAIDSTVSGNDIDAFINHVNVVESAILDEESYFHYIRDNEWDGAREQYVQILDDQEENPSPLDQTIHSRDGEKLFTVKTEPLVFGLYSTYSLEAIPTKLTVSSSMKDTEITVSDKSETIQAEEPEEFANIYPGTYTISGAAQNDFGSFTYENTMIIHAAAEHNQAIEFATNTFGFNTNMPEATLFVNGNDTELSLNELDQLGPFPEDSDIEMYAEWENSAGTMIQSETVTPEDSSMFGGISFYFDEADLQEETELASAEIENDDAGEMVLDFRDAYEDAVNNKDFNSIEPFLKSGSEVDDELRTYIGDLQDTDYHYDFTSNEILDVEDVDESTVEVTTNELFTFTNHLDDVTDYDREKVYTVIMEDETYKITEITYEETNRDRQ
ncbi:putative membrane protein YvbJ [Virgibacillus natechei]|uniref:Membrane protein YvbJ n=1 Tax=Virgibacillus natechei TaxID=1216297 RepID=A0ABS4IJV3_9BACI|nr:hypothetical protein [Virgibacillus natechei]MBP1971138.1 putative membrane protein YvbJ [Virgibacillus natechei]UZD12176.1 hypothetical protein OLD84_14745 [Virgibacillus natechei]